MFSDGHQVYDSVTASKQIYEFGRMMADRVPPLCAGKLTCHEANKNLLFVQNQRKKMMFCSTDGTVFKGITDVLKTIFWSEDKIPMGSPDDMRRFQMEKTKHAREELEREKEVERRQRIRQIEANKRKIATSYSGATTNGEYDKTLFSGNFDSSASTGLAGCTGGDLSGGCGVDDEFSGEDAHSNIQEVRVDGRFTPKDAPAWWKETREIDMARSCYYKGTGPKHGSRVHEEIEKVCALIRSESNLIPFSINDDDGDPSSFRRSRIRLITNAIRYFDPCTFAILNALFAKRLVPLKTEFSIVDTHLKFATNIDVVLWDCDKDLGVLGEIKTGHNSQINYDAHDGMSFMQTNHPTLRVPDTALNRASIQLLVSLLFLSKRYDIQFDCALIIRTSSACKDNRISGGAPEKKRRKIETTTNVVQLYRIPSWMLKKECQNMIYGNMIRKVSREIDDRKNLPDETKLVLKIELKKSNDLSDFWLRDPRKKTAYDRWFEDLNRIRQK
jgi:hypothetical protein